MTPRSCLTLLAAATLACAAPEAGLSPAHAAAIKDSVAAALAAYRAQSAAGRWDSVLTFYADDPDLRWVEEGKVVADSLADFRREFSSMAAGLRTETEFTGTVIAPVAPGAASVVTGFNTRFVDSTGTKFSFGGTMTVVMVHRGARWQFLTGHSSAPAPR
jgi:ketosteroid isomerase-like protein